MNRKHGSSEEPEYLVWSDMKSRCHNQNHHAYKNYGGRGIEVCERWRISFVAFLADMGKRPSEDHSIDRFPNNDGNYEPGNCRWGTNEQQLRNQRTNHILDHNGRLLTIAEWAEVLSFPRSVIDSRLERGWSVEATLTRPMRNYPRRVRDGKV